MRKGLIAVAAVGVPAAIVYLYACEPGGGAPYPPCYFHWLTGLHCPGCGSTRCLHALLHGELAQAAAYNVLFLATLPLLGMWAVRRGLGFVRGRPARPCRLPGWIVAALVVLIVLFGVLRNLPVAPFCLLAPHAL